MNQILVLGDGRKLGYAEYGPPLGRPVFYFHGAASSRLERPVDEGLLPAAGVRLITADRPGHGLSDPQPGRRLLDWPDDIRRLADHLGLDRFYVMGCSSGGPHALACAYRLADRVLACAAVSSVAPMGRPGAFEGLPLPNRLLAVSARRAPWLTRLIRRLMYSLVTRDVETATRRLMASIPESDKEALYAPEHVDGFVASIREAFRGGWQGTARDDVLVNRDWGFALSAIGVRVDVWHGEADVNVPCHAGEYLHAHIPHSRIILLPGEGHFFLIKRWREILAALLSDPSAASDLTGFASGKRLESR
jgi:pimeloyl-ACP methyl ester carboxylesterase